MTLTANLPEVIIGTSITGWFWSRVSIPTGSRPIFEGFVLQDFFLKFMISSTLVVAIETQKRYHLRVPHRTSKKILRKKTACYLQANIWTKSLISYEINFALFLVRFKWPEAHHKSSRINTSCKNGHHYHMQFLVQFEGNIFTSIIEKRTDLWYKETIC